MSTANVKKAFQSLVGFLEANANKKVSSILNEVIEMASAKGAGSSATTCHRNEKGNVTFIRCGYFGQWLPVEFVDFSVKAGTASGYAPMCKEGQSLWAKKQRDAKKAKEDLLTKVAEQEIAATEIPSALEAIETERLARENHPFGSGTIEEALEKDFSELLASMEAEAEAEAEAEVDAVSAEDAGAVEDFV